MAEEDTFYCRGQIAGYRKIERAVPLDVKRAGPRAQSEWLAGYDDETRTPTVERTLARYPQVLRRRRHLL